MRLRFCFAGIGCSSSRRMGFVRAAARPIARLNEETASELAGYTKLRLALPSRKCELQSVRATRSLEESLLLRWGLILYSNDIVRGC